MQPQNKRIVLIANSSWNIYNFRRSLIEKLHARNFDVHVFAPSDTYTEKIQKLPLTYHKLTHLRARGFNPIQDILLFFEIMTLYKKLSPMVGLHYTVKPNIYGTLATKYANVSVLSVITGLGYMYTHKNILASIIGSLYRVALRATSCVVFHNEDNLNLFVEKGFVRLDKAVVIAGSGVDTTHFSPRHVKRHDTKYTEFLFIGRLLKEKGVYEFLEAAKILIKTKINVHFTLIGSMKDKDEFGDCESEYMTFIGKIIDVRDHISRADVVVLPSYSEGLPRALLEAMSMEKPIITTNVPGCRDLVQNTDFLVPPRNSVALAKAFEKFVRLSQGDREKIGKQNRATVLQNFSSEIIIPKYMKLIKDICNDPTRK